MRRIRTVVRNLMELSAKLVSEYIYSMRITIIDNSPNVQPDADACDLHKGRQQNREHNAIYIYVTGDNKIP